jgi:hypothetical protein
MITQDELIELFEYRDGELWRREQPNNVDMSKPAGSINNTGYRRIWTKGKLHQAHRLIFLYHHGYLPKFIDHIDRVKLNNNIDNLRDSNDQNNHNVDRRKDNSSGYKGVNLRKCDKKWCARIQINGKRIFLGYFVCPKEAHAAYCKAADELHGEFANYGE